ncbi:MAG: MFS transporter, partial [Gemmobacter sp.]
MDHIRTDPSPGARAAITITLALSMGLAALGTSIANIALPAIAMAFAAPFPQVQAIVVGYLVALTISVVAAGRLGDRFGLRRMLVVGLVIFALSSVLCALAPSLWLLVAARVLQGVGAAFLMTLAMALMRQTAAEARIGRAMGLLGTISALGTALGPVLGG